jgi:hypothetical protein
LAPSSDISHEKLHRELVEKIAGRVIPVRRLWPASVRLGLWLVIEAAMLLLVATHTRNDFMLKLRRPAYFAEVMLFGTAAIQMAFLALKSAVPGRFSGGYSVPIAMAAAGTVLLFSFQPDMGHSLRRFVAAGTPCACNTFLLGALPLAALWFALRRGAPTRGTASGALAGAAALLFSFALMRLGCPIDDPLHLIVWHLGPVLIVIALASLAGSISLRLRSRGGIAAS